MFKKLIIWLYERYIVEDDIIAMIDEAEHIYLTISDHDKAVIAMREKYFIERYGEMVDH